MHLGLKNKVVVITGGTLGIGKACVDAFLAEGCFVATCGRSKERITAFLKEYEGRPVFASAANVADFADMQRLAEQVNEKFGGIDIWVNNAGVYPKGFLDEMPLDLWQETFDVNVSGVLYGARAALPYLRIRKKGVIINAASFATYMPTAGRGAYGITKAAVGHLTKVLGAELAPENIRVVSYMPGLVATELTASVLKESSDNMLKKQVAQNRYGTPEEIAPVVVFLASDAASFITGTGIEASGGKYCVQNPHIGWER